MVRPGRAGALSAYCFRRPHCATVVGVPTGQGRSEGRKGDDQLRVSRCGQSIWSRRVSVQTRQVSLDGCRRPRPRRYVHRPCWARISSAGRRFLLRTAAVACPARRGGSATPRPEGAPARTAPGNPASRNACSCGPAATTRRQDCRPQGAGHQRHALPGGAYLPSGIDSHRSVCACGRRRGRRRCAQHAACNGVALDAAFVHDRHEHGSRREHAVGPGPRHDAAAAADHDGRLPVLLGFARGHELRHRERTDHVDCRRHQHVIDTG